MANFVESLWESIFTPGPTPPLILATNATFAALQALLLALLVATYSIHFVVLSALCGALWWAINWFVAELRSSEELKRAREKTPRPDDNLGRGEKEGGPLHDGEAEDEDGGETETEGEDTAASRASLLDVSPVPKGQKQDESGSTMGGSGHLLPRPGSSAASESSGVHVRASSSEGGEMRNRGSEMEMSMTDSEWEKVSEPGSGDTPDRHS